MSTGGHACLSRIHGGGGFHAEGFTQSTQRARRVSYKASQSERERPASRRILVSSPRPMSLWCGFGSLRRRLPRTMNWCLAPEYGS
jgi:hypothetical protein